MMVALGVNFGLALGVSFLAGSAQTLVWTDFSLTGYRFNRGSAVYVLFVWGFRFPGRVPP